MCLKWMDKRMVSMLSTFQNDDMLVSGGEQEVLTLVLKK